MIYVRICYLYALIVASVVEGSCSSVCCMNNASSNSCMSIAELLRRGAAECGKDVL